MASFLERLAIERARKLVALQSSTPTDLGSIAETMGIRVHKKDLGFNLDGLCLFVKDKPTIILNNNLYIPRTRIAWSWAHEILHVELGRTLQIDFDRPELDAIARWKKNSPLDIACNRGAATLLMPEQTFRRLWAEFATNPLCRYDILG